MYDDDLVLTKNRKKSAEHDYNLRELGYFLQGASLE